MINTHNKAIIGALNLNVIALLNGSIALAVKPKSKEYKNNDPNIASTIYFIFLRDKSFFVFILFCLMPMDKAILFHSS